MPQLDPLQAKIQIDGGTQAAAALRAVATQARATQLSLVGMGAAVALAGGAIAAVALGQAIQFESAMAGVAKTVDESAETIAALGVEFQNLSKVIPTSANELANIGEVAGQLGIRTENIVGFVRVMADLGETTNLSAAEAATALARLANIMGTSQQDFGRMGSVIVELGNNFATTEAEITELALRLAGAGSIIGLTEAQVFGFSAALSSVGIRAEQGGTAFSRVFADIANAVASGGVDLEKFALISGQSVEQFRKAFEDDASGAIISFVEGLGEIEKGGGNLFAVLEAVGFQNVRIRDSLLRAAGAGDLLRRGIEEGSAEWITNAALTEEAGKRYETTASKLDVLKNQAIAAAVAIGQRLTPAFRALIDMLSQGAGPAALFFLGQGIAVREFSDEAVQAMNAFETALEDMGRLASSSEAQIISLRDETHALAETLDEAARPGFFESASVAIDNFSGDLGETQQAIQDLFRLFVDQGPTQSLATGIEGAAEETSELEKRIQALMAALGIGEGAIKKFTLRTEEQQKKTLAWAEAQQVLTDTLINFFAPMGQLKGIVDDSIQRTDEERKKTLELAEAKRILAETIRALFTPYGLVSEASSDFGAEVDSAGAATDRATRFVLDMVEALDLLGSGLQRSISQFALFAGEIVKAVKALNDATTAEERLAAQQALRAGIGGAGIALGGIISQGTQGKGVRAVVGSTVSGAAAGFAAGGPVGAAIGGGLGLVSGILGSIFGQNEADKFEEQMQIVIRLLSEQADVTKALADAIGDDLLDKLEGLASFSFGDKLDKDEVRAFEAALRGMGLTLGEIQVAARVAGIDISEFLKVMITGKGDRDLAASQFDHLNDVITLLPDAAERAIERLNDLIESTGLTFDEMVEQAGKFGVEIGELAKFMEGVGDVSELTAEELDALIESFSTFGTAGVDSFEDLMEAADAFGVSVDELADQFEGLEVNSDLAAEQLQNLIDVMEEAARIMGEAISELRTDLATIGFETQVFGFDPSTQFDLFLKELNEALKQVGLAELAGTLADLNLLTEEGRDAARTAIQNLVTLLGDELPAGMRGVILAMLGILDTIESEADRALGTAKRQRDADIVKRLERQFGRITSGLQERIRQLTERGPVDAIARLAVNITETQANELLSRAATANFRLQRIDQWTELTAMNTRALLNGGMLSLSDMSEGLAAELDGTFARAGILPSVN